MRGQIRRYAVISLTDPAAVTRCVRKLRERTGESGGTYIVVERPPRSRLRDFVRTLVSGSTPVIYIGGTVHLRTRVPTIARGVCGQPSRHGLIQQLPGFEPPTTHDRLVVILIPFVWHDSLENFLLHEHDRVFGALPIGNWRIRARSNASSRPLWISVTWDILFGSQNPARSMWRLQLEALQGPNPKSPCPSQMAMSRAGASDAKQSLIQ